MRFEKDGKVYANMVVAVYDYCNGLKYCYGCKLYGKTGDCLAYAQLHPKEVARLLGYEVIEDDTPTVAEAVEKYGDDAKPKRRILGVSNPTDDMTEYVEKYLEAVKPDPVNRPAHYMSGGIECIDAMQAAFGAEAVKDFCLCNAFKYLWRHRQKNGVEDLKKARWYLNRMIREMEVTDDDT